MKITLDLTFREIEIIRDSLFNEIEHYTEVYENTKGVNAKFTLGNKISKLKELWSKFE